MKPTRTFNVGAKLPGKLERLRELAYNLRWCWNRDTIDLFRRIDRDIWEETGHNPVALLGAVSQETLQERGEEAGFMAHLDHVYAGFREYMGTPGWARQSLGIGSGPMVAYFSPEFGITECLPLYSGGLGILAGDYLKASSDLDLPAVGVGILCRQGYLQQYLNPDGWQQELYSDTDFYNSPMSVVQKDGRPLTIDVALADGNAKAQIWQAQVGRVTLLLLDTNLPQNSPQAAKISARLYEGDPEIRIQQEILLGIGGVRALAALGLSPEIYHMNEGHSAFLSVERIRRLMKEQGLTLEEARIATCASNVFTTHTPVQAASDRFDRSLVDKHLGAYLRELGIETEQFLALGREKPQDKSEPLCMTILALRLSEHSFGVSKLHGKVSRQIWRGVWPEVPEEDVPISHVTNGVHTASWVSKEMAELYERYVGPQWISQPSSARDWARVEEMPDEELWQVHERRRQRLVTFARKHLGEQLIRRGAPAAQVEEAGRVLDPRALTIVFARRFTTYKRPTLLFRDFERLKNMVASPTSPVQIILAGKAHPADKAGKEMIREVVHKCLDERLRRRVVFLENYDMTVARYLVQGADVWVNTPRRPQEASGTSGMKAAANGVLNLSILDGWWCEGYGVDTGWAIGGGEEYQDTEYQDSVEAAAVYEVLEKQIVPLFYERDSEGLPTGWLKMMKSAIRNICPVFNTNRMLREYIEEFYAPNAERARLLRQDGFQRAKQFAKWQDAMRRAWPSLAIRKLEADVPGSLEVGSAFSVRALVKLGGLTPADLSVDLYAGRVDAEGQLHDVRTTVMEPREVAGEGDQWFVGEIKCERAGRYGYSVRILPKHEDLSNALCMGLVLWS